MKIVDNNIVMDAKESVNLVYIFNQYGSEKHRVFIAHNNVVIGYVNVYDDADKFYEIYDEDGGDEHIDFRLHNYIKINNERIYLASLEECDKTLISLETYGGSDIGGDTKIYLADNDELNLIQKHFDLADEESYSATFGECGEYDIYFKRYQSNLIDDSETLAYLKSLKLGFKIQGLK